MNNYHLVITVTNGECIMHLLILVTSILVASLAFADMKIITIKDGDVSNKEMQFSKDQQIECKIHNLNTDFEEVKSKVLVKNGGPTK